VTNPLKGEFVTLVIPSFTPFKKFHVTNVTNPPSRGLVTLNIWNYFVLNEDITNVNNPPPRGLVTLVTWNYFDLNEDETNVNNPL
jgi:hypothetical protein